MAEPDLEQLLFIDECTGTYNRRYFFRRMDEEVARAARYGRSFALLFLDLDRFKEVNDIFGHLAGDEVLREVAVRLRDVVRGVDLVFRYAGDEFAVILPETTEEEALVAAERLVADFRRTPVYSARAKRDIHLTLSIGIAAFPADAPDATELLARADRALLVAKHRGRNAVCDQRRAAEAEAQEERLVRPVFCPKMVGRDHERRLLRKFWARAAEGCGGLVTVIGETGVGKTRLVRDFIEFAGLQGAPVLEGQSFEEPTGFAYQPFREAVARYVAAGAEATLGRRLAKIPRAYQRELCNVIPELAAFDFDAAPYYQLAPEQARLRLFVGFRYLLAVLATELPVVLVLEDLHWAEEGTLSLLRFLLPGFASQKVLAVATYRPEELPDRRRRAPAPSAALAAVVGDRGVNVVRLERLRRDEVAEMIKLIFGVGEVAPSFVDFVYGETEGNPLFVEETLKSFYEDGLSPRKFAVEGAPIPADYEVPGSIRGIIHRRLSRLDERTVRVLQAAATLGEQFTPEGVRAAVAVNEGLLADILSSCADHELIVRVPAVLDTYRFAHGKIRDEIYRGLSRARRKRLHKRVARYYEDRFRAGDTDVTADLSWHSYMGEVWEKVLVFARLAGDRAWAAYDAREALKHYDRMAAAASKVGKGGFGDELIRRELVELNTRRSEIYLAQGRFGDAAGAAKKAKDAAEEIGDRLNLGKAMNLAGRAYDVLGDERRAATNLKGALAIFKKLDATGDIARGLYDLGEHSRGRGDVEKAVSYYHMAEAIAAKNGDKNLQMLLAEGVGAVGVARGDLRGAAKYYRRALSWARETGDRRGEAGAEAGLGTVALAAGKLDEATRHFQDGLAVAMGLGNRPLAANIWLYLGVVKYYQDDLGGAEEYSRRALGDAGDAAGRRRAAHTRYRLALVKMRRPAFADAGEELKAAAAAARAAGDAYRLYFCQLALALARAEAGRTGSARQYLRQAAQTRAKLPACELGPYYDYISGRVDLAAGAAAEARRNLAAAAKGPRVTDEPFLKLEAQLTLAWAYAGAGDFGRAAKIAAAAKAAVVRSPGRRRAALLQHVQGLIAEAEGRRGNATRHFKKAVAVLAETDALAAARARADFGAYLARAGKVERARPLLAAAAAFFENIGNKKTAGRLRRLVNRGEGSVGGRGRKRKR